MESVADTRRAGGTPLGYMPQLDGLRAVAVVGVWFEHWGISQERGFRTVEWGRLAVWLFFVLSGFLITGILLKSKSGVEDGSQGVGRAAKVFYMRRFLRILPIYYLTLLATARVIPEVRRLFWWHLTYTTDFWVSRHPDQMVVGMHFWTLAVEEQFYLIWPWIVLLLPRRRLGVVLLVLLVGSAGYRAGIYLMGVSPRALAAFGLPLLGNIDKFAMGGLIALFRAGGEGVAVDGERTVRRVGLWIGLPVVIGFEVSRAWHPDSRVGMAFTSTAAGLFFAWMVAGASAGFGGPGGTILGLRPVRFMGKISYGLYLFHMFTPGVLMHFRAPLPPPWAVWGRFFVYAAATMGAGAVSWFLIESPLNALKNRYRYTTGEGRAKRSQAVLGKG